MGYKDPDKQRKYQRDWVAAKNKALRENGIDPNIVRNKNQNGKRKSIQELKEATPCADCGKFFPYYVMDFDHRVGEEKLGSLARMVSSNLKWEKLQAEMDKCDIVCANCHRVRTHKTAAHLNDKRTSNPVYSRARGNSNTRYQKL